MHILLSHRSMVPIYEQIMDAVKNGIIRGELRPSDPLPSVRGLAAELRISALTVKKAYDRLEEEGFVATIHGKGTYVTASDHQLAMEARKKAVEDDFAAVIQKACSIGFTKSDILEIVEIILEDY